MSINKLMATNNALATKTWGNGLHSYTQSNCQVTLTDKGLRIYRPPNLTPSANGNTMWGGLILQPFEIDSNFLVKGRTYILLFHVKGKTSGAVTDVYWSNEAGWSGASRGLGTNPTNVSTNQSSFGANFNGDGDFYYRFTVSDDVWKTCTKSYSSFVAGTSYNTYRDFKFGFTYADTGAWGTDLYITNFRCYDITSASTDTVRVEKSGIVMAQNLSESDNSQARFAAYGEIQSSNFIEI